MPPLNYCVKFSFFLDRKILAFLIIFGSFSSFPSVQKEMAKAEARTTAQYPKNETQEELSITSWNVALRRDFGK
jgi:hypothetical protein